MAIVDDGVTTAPRARPSLYAAIKLARLVLFVKERFKARIKSRRPPTEPLTICHRDSFQARALEDISHVIKNRSKDGGNFIQPRCNHKKGRGLELGVPTLLHDLDSHTLSGDETLSMYAKKDELFLKFDAQRIATDNSLDGVRHIFDLTTLMLERLPTSGSNFARRRNSNSSNSCSAFKCDIFVANLEHLLLCLQQAAFDALVKGALKSIQSDFLHWHQYWQQRQRTNEGWFAEWPNGQHPLNTTWPWNVKPSLVILWGVCWMFYDNDNGLSPMRRPRADPSKNFRIRQPSQDLTFAPSVSACLVTTPQATTHLGYSTTNFNPSLNPNVATWNDASLSTSNLLDPWLQLPSSGSEFDELPSFPVDSYIFTSSTEIPSPFATQNPLLWPDFPGNRVSGLAYQNPNSWPSTDEQQEAQTLLRTPLNIPRQGRVQPYGLIQDKPALNQENRNFEAGHSLKVPMRDYPSPHSDGSIQGASYVSPGMQYPPSSAVESPENEGSTRSADLVRNEEGQLYCTHQDCAHERPAFPRKCEFTKHMDKHNRPYVCEEKGCEKIRGFTYSGGLLRHQREVHRQHGGPKALCKCPHRDCKRSTGNGFSRKENLYEHLRRVHKPIDDGRDPIVGTIGSASVTDVAADPPIESRKRRRLGEDGEGDSGERDLQKLIKRLRKESQQKDERLKRLEDIVEKLRVNQNPVPL